MKIRTLILTLGLLSITLMSFTFFNPISTQYKDGEEKTDKVTIKARELVNKAAPDDWMTYAKAAEKCINKGVNLKEAAQWLDTSIEIKETAYNLELKGDYYVRNNLPDKALEYYVKTLKVGKEQDFNFDASGIQKKIADIHLN
ncbi:MAG: tetratricopeptide repeat protein [Cyclobacteriaceae bacterium]